MKLSLPVCLLALGNAAALDVVFQIDESGSMGGDQSAVKANAASMFTKMQAVSSTFRAGLVGYGRSAGQGLPRLITPLTNSLTTFQSGLNQLEISGWREPGFLTIYETAHDSLQNNPGGLGINGPFCGILITDEASNPGPYDKTEAEATTAMNSVPAVQFAIDVDVTHFDGVTQHTGGARFDLLNFRSGSAAATTILNSVLNTCIQTPIIVNPPAVQGDPHFVTWSTKNYDFHGVCDLVLLQNPTFQNNLGMAIHIRTTRTRMWSYVSSAAVKIGDETFEVKGGKDSNDYWINYHKGDDKIETSMLSKSIAGYPINFKQVSEKSREFQIDLGMGSAIVIGTWNAFVSVKIRGGRSEDFEDSLGLMGTYGKGLKMARDGATTIDDNNAFGQEWQVLTSEPKLFHNTEGPQAPEKCEIPSASEMRRRLRQSVISKEDAELACSRVSVEDFDLCVFDVLATNDKASAGAY